MSCRLPRSSLMQLVLKRPATRNQHVLLSLAIKVGTNIAKKWHLTAKSQRPATASNFIQMGGPYPLQLLLIGACLVASVGADAGDDFLNNLFADMAPYVDPAARTMWTYSNFHRF